MYIIAAHACTVVTVAPTIVCVHPFTLSDVLDVEGGCRGLARKGWAEARGDGGVDTGDTESLGVDGECGIGTGSGRDGRCGGIGVGNTINIGGDFGVNGNGGGEGVVTTSTGPTLTPRTF